MEPQDQDTSAGEVNVKHDSTVASAGRLADMALEDYDGLMATGRGPNLQRLVIWTVAQVAAIRAGSQRKDSGDE